MITRRSLIKATAALSIGATFGVRTRPAEAAQFTYKYGGNLPASHPTMLFAQKAAERIKEESSGRLEIRVFPNNQLGSDTDMLSQLRSGALEFFSLAGTILSTFVPVASIDGVGFAFKNKAEVWKAMDGELGAHIRQSIEKSNLVVMDKIWDLGYRNVTTSSLPVHSPDDLKGLRIRMPMTELWTSMFKHLGSTPTSINFSETYTALQTKVVDAQENPLSVIDVAKLYEVQKYLSMTNHIWGGYWFLANRRAFGRLPDDIQDIVRRVIDETAQAQRAALADADDAYRKHLADNGMIINDVDSEPFRLALAQSGFYKLWKEKYGHDSWSLLEKYAGTLA